MNLFSINPNLVVLEENQHSLRLELENHNIECAMLPTRHQRTTRRWISLRNLGYRTWRTLKDIYLQIGMILTNQFPYIKQSIKDSEIQEWRSQGYTHDSFSGVMYSQSNKENQMPDWAYDIADALELKNLRICIL